MQRIAAIGWLLVSGSIAACGPRDGARTSADSAVQQDSGFAAVPESAWVAVNGPTIIAFHPLASNAQLDADPDLATVLDDFAFHIGSAMDSLMAAGFTVRYYAGDSIWVRAGANRWRFTRPADSADVGYLFTDPEQRSAVIYGVRTDSELITYSQEFKRTGKVR